MNTTNNKKNKDIFLDAVRGAKPIVKKNIYSKKIIESNMIKTNDTEKITRPKKSDNYLKKNDIKSIKKLISEKININKKIKKGTIKIDKKIDLHGYSLIEAKNAFFKSVNDCFYNKNRCILVITGKGERAANLNEGKSRLYYGKIRDEFTSWVKDKNLTSKILSYQQASPNYGGDGAFVVYLRKYRY